MKFIKINDMYIAIERNGVSCGHFAYNTKRKKWMYSGLYLNELEQIIDYFRGLTNE